MAVLTEYRHPNGADFQAMLGDAGFGHQLTGPDESGGYAGTLIASRHPLRPGGVRLDVPEGSARWLHAVIDGIGWDVVGCLIPAASGAKGKDRKNSFWDAIITNAAQLGSRPCLITGDFNTGRHHIDETGATFHASDRFERMLDSGWVDGFRALHGDISAPTWWSPGYNNGFRLDHAFLSPGSPPPVACQPSTRPATRSAAPPRPACPTMPP